MSQTLRDFLEHTAHGVNYATGKSGSPLDYITFHAKGAPTVVDGHVRMGSRNQLRDFEEGFKIVTSFPEYRRLPIIIGESDPEGCAACSVQYNPQNDYRNGTMYSSYTAETFVRLKQMADKYKVNLRGAVTWAFEFEDQPYFAGFRDLATNGIDKPVLSVFRMFAQLRGNSLKTTSSGSLSLEQVTKDGIVAQPDIGAVATRHGRTINVMVWNYHDDNIEAADAAVALQVRGLPRTVKSVVCRHYRVDHNHSNSYTLWRRLGAPQQPSQSQLLDLQRAGHLELLTAPQNLGVANGTAPLTFSLPRQGVSLIQLSW